MLKTLFLCAALAASTLVMGCMGSSRPAVTAPAAPSKITVANAIAERAVVTNTGKRRISLALSHKFSRNAITNEPVTKAHTNLMSSALLIAAAREARARGFDALTLGPIESDVQGQGKTNSTGTQWRKVRFTAFVNSPVVFSARPKAGDTLSMTVAEADRRARILADRS